MPLVVRDGNEHYITMLSATQIETLRHVFEHKNSKQIARIMQVSSHTVDERVRRTLRKMQVSSRLEAAEILARHGVFHNVTPPQSLTYQMAALANTSGAPKISFEQKDGACDDDQREAASTLPLVSASGRRMKRWLFWPVLLLSTSIAAFFIMYFLLFFLGRNPS